MLHFFQNGALTSSAGGISKSDNLNSCDNMSKHCQKDCISQPNKNNAKAGSASAWKSKTTSC